MKSRAVQTALRGNEAVRLSPGRAFRLLLVRLFAPVTGTVQFDPAAGCGGPVEAPRQAS
jgi:hypothetical protein